MIQAYGNKINFDLLMKELYETLSCEQNSALIEKIYLKSQDPYQVLIGTILSSRTKDEVTAKASARLFKRAPNAETLLRFSEDEIVGLIYPVGFYNTKAKNIKKVAHILVNTYHGQVPDRMQSLIELPGVGRKTANLVLGIAFGIDSITVDTHVFRISNRLGIIKTRTPIEAENDLKKILPRKYWISYNSYLVLFGQQICKPISPFCTQCPIEHFCQKIGIKNFR